MKKNNSIKLIISFFMVFYFAVFAIGDNNENNNEVTIISKLETEVIPFLDKELASANLKYNTDMQLAHTKYIESLKKIQEEYEKQITESKSIYANTLRLQLRHNRIKDSKDKELVEKEIARIDGKTEIEEVDRTRDISDSFKYNSLLKVDVVPLDQWVKIGDVKEGDIVIFQISGKISKDITKANEANCRGVGAGSNSGATRPHYTCFRLNEAILGLEAPQLTKIKEDGDLYQGTFKVSTDGPLFFGFRYKASAFNMDPAKNGKGKLVLVIKIKPK